MAATAHTLNTPAEIIAAIPGVLGFFPTESSILIGMQADQETKSLTLGPVARVDLHQTPQLEQAAEFIGEQTDVLIALVVTRKPNSQLAQAAMSILHDIVDDDGNQLISALWTTPEISVGQRYELEYSADGLAQITTTSDAALLASGTISSPATSPTMAGMLSAGMLPATNREEVMDFFAYSPRLAAERNHDIPWPTTAQASQTATWLLEQAHGPQQSKLNVSFTQVKTLLTKAANGMSLICPDSRATLDDLVDNPTEQLVLLTYLSRSMLRDSIIDVVIDHPEPAANLLVEVARMYDGLIRANALTLWAYAAMSRKVSSWATPALNSAQEAFEGHSFSAITMELVQRGQFSDLLRVARGSSVLARTDLGIEPAEPVQEPPESF